MTCPHCGSSAAPRDGRCVGCGKPFESAPAVATGVLTPVPPTAPSSTADAAGGITIAASSAAPPSPTTPRSASSLSVGQNFGTRYHIIRLLGVGGMGAVYQAWDQVLEVAVAVKVIRPDAALDDEAARATSRRASSASCCSRARSRTRTSSGSTTSARSTASRTSRCRTSRDRTSATILKREGRLPVDRALVDRQAGGVGPRRRARGRRRAPRSEARQHHGGRPTITR